MVSGAEINSIHPLFPLFLTQYQNLFPFSVNGEVSRLAQGIQDGNVILEGAIYTKDGEKLTEIKTLHDGMGIFTYTPEEKPAVAKVTLGPNRV